MLNESEHNFVRITTKTKDLIVTVDHVMIIGERLIAAEELKIGMRLGTETITKIENMRRKNKITVITETGTIIANHILTTTICGDYLKTKGSELSVLGDWKKDHAWMMI